MAPRNNDKAISFGINDYDTVPDLRGCIDDVRNVSDLLTTVFEFRPKSIHAFTDREVTKERIEAEWKWLLKGARPGDRIVFHFSGHGSQTVDLDGDEDDGKDELLCLHDMDWDDDSTYLLDDDIRRFTEELPDGVKLTFLLDTCHSGTGTRMLLAPTGRRSLSPEKAPVVDLQASLARLNGGSATARALNKGPAETVDAITRILSPSSDAGERQTVRARFVPPPPRILAAAAHRRLRSSPGQPRNNKVEAMNHILLAASQPDQTSADAFIDGSFRGAFTYHLCRAVREAGAGIDHQKLIRTIRAGLMHDSFPQVPQLEPKKAQGVFLGGDSGSSSLADAAAADDATDHTHHDASAADSVDEDHVGTTASSDDDYNYADDQSANEDHDVSAPTDRDVVGLLQESIGLQRDLLDYLKGSAAMEFSSVRGGGRHLVYVHGICWHDAGFSNDWWAALAPHLRTDLKDELGQNRHEVLWADLVSQPPGRRTLVHDSLDAHERDLADDLRNILEDRATRHALEALPEQEAGRPAERGLMGLIEDRGSRDPEGARALLGIPGLDCVDDFVKYLTRDSVRQAILDRFRAAVLPLLEAGATVQIISHSWGTVIAYEGLRSLDARSFPGTVATFFTVGSALSLAPIERSLRPADGRRPKHVRRWANLDAKGDVVGGPLKGRRFAVDDEFLNLHPTDCSPFLGRYSPACAHSSYFKLNNEAVNRGIFARLM